MNLFYGHNNANNNSVEVIDEFVSSEVTTYSNDTFAQATVLREIRFSGVIAKSINFANCSKLSVESMRSIINALKPNTTATLTLHSDAKAKLTEEDKKAIADKGWTLA
jgi:hypothetical protein